MTSCLLLTVRGASLPSQGVPYHFMTHVGTPGSAEERWTDVFVEDIRPTNEDIRPTLKTRSQMMDDFHRIHGELVRPHRHFGPNLANNQSINYTLAVCVVLSRIRHWFLSCWRPHHLPPYSSACAAT